MKYFFLTEGWTVGRVWGVGGLWNALAWRREPEIEKMNLAIIEQGEKMWLYRVEDAVLMLEVKLQGISQPAWIPSQAILQLYCNAKLGVTISIFSCCGAVI